jgi:UDP-3-O-[3-hydroxymyristoyl] glucosamine N-acyltransferase
MLRLTAGEVASLVGGELRGDPTRLVEGVGTLEEAGPNALSFVASARYLPYLQASQAAVVLVGREFGDRVPEGRCAVVVDDPHRALRTILTRWYPAPEVTPGIHPTAIVDPTAHVDPSAEVGPYAVVGEGVRIGGGCRIGAHAVVGDGCTLGQDVTIHPHATLYPGATLGERVVVHSGARVGKEGFGFVWAEGGYRRIPQVGGCILEDDVEIGANVTVDRGSVGNTVIGAGSKVDNLVHVGHNVKIGKHVLLVAQVGISGSTVVGDGAVLAGQVGVAGHIRIGTRARIAGRGGVTSDVPDGETYSGFPARPHRDTLRAQAALFKLPDLLKRLKRLEERVLGRSGGE